MRQWLLALVAAGALCAGATASEPPKAFLDKAAELARWIDEHSDYGPMKFHPAYVFVSPETIRYMYYQGSGMDPNGTYATKIIAMYHDGWMILADTFDMERDADVLLHELVHHLQFTERREYPCVRAQEVDAYRLKDQFSKETGIESVETPDPFTLHMLTTCPEPWN